MKNTGLVRAFLVTTICAAVLVLNAIPAFAQCDFDAAASNLAHCINDLKGKDPQPVLADCSNSTDKFRFCEADKKTVTSLNRRQRDELSFYLAYALFGKAGAERHLYNETAAKRDFGEVKHRLSTVLRNCALPPKLLFEAQTLLSSVESGG